MNFVEAFYQHYFLPIAFVTDENFTQKDRILPISIQNQKGYIIDAINLESFRKLVFERIATAEPTILGNMPKIYNIITYSSQA